MTDASEGPMGPIRKSVTVPLDAEAAFELFTAGIDRWWPKETHSVAAGTGSGAAATVRVDPGPGGRVYETGPDGDEAVWAVITAWEPGRRLALRWYPGRTPAEATDVEIRFTQSETGTRVDLTHGGFGILGARAAATRTDYSTGWDRVLIECFGGACRVPAA